MKKLNVLKIFYKLKNQPFVIVKMDEIFPSYRLGSDIDIFAYNPEEFISQLVGVLKDYVSTERIVSVKKEEENIYVDIMLEGKIELRFDVYTKLPEYESISIKEGLFLSIIENAVSLKYKYDGKVFELFVPSRIDDFLLRYIEYIEYYQFRKDKIKHLDYILRYAKQNDRIKFVDKLHVYTKLNPKRTKAVKQKKGLEKIRNIRVLLKKHLPKEVKNKLARIIAQKK